MNNKIWVLSSITTATLIIFLFLDFHNTRKTKNTHQQLIRQPTQNWQKYNPSHGLVPNHIERRSMAAKVLEILHNNISQGQLNYRFNPSGESVCLAAAGLAFIANGSNAENGPFAASLTNINQRLSSIMARNEFSHQPTWGCAAACIYLSEMHRISSPKQKTTLSTLLQQYADKLLSAQTKSGAWCHGFADVKNELGYSDFLFVSTMAYQGLALAQREGAKVPQAALDQAFSYMENCSNIEKGFIGYSPNKDQKGMKGPGRTAGGLLALQAAGKINNDLYKNASAYVKNTFAVHDGGRPQDLLISGHASAQMGIAWAAWWAAENGLYEEFWQGQGAQIAQRRKADGSFHPAPTDGNKQFSNAETGDFANAFHALMLSADFGGLSNGRTNRSDPARAIFMAQQIRDNWPESEDIPKELNALADLKVPYGNDDRRPLFEAIEACTDKLLTSKDETVLNNIPSLLNGAFQGDFILHPNGKEAILLLKGNPVFLTRILESEIHFEENEELCAKPIKRVKARLSNKKAFEKKIKVKLNQEGSRPDYYTATVHWSFGEHEFKEEIRIPLRQL